MALGGTALSEVAKLALVNVLEGRNDGTLSQHATGVFFDYSTWEGTEAEVLVFSEVCSAVIGQGTETSAATPLEISEATVRIDGESTSMEPSGDGKRIARELPGLTEGAPIEIAVEGGPEAGQFPNFSLALASPGDPGSPLADLDVTQNLEVHWTPAGGQSIELEVRTQGDSNDGTRIRCVAMDDGCLRVPAGALSWLNRSLEPQAVELSLSVVAATEWEGPLGEVGYLKVERARMGTFEP